MLDQLPAILRQGQHAAVFGLRKVGKSSLLSQLRLRMIDVPVAFLDGEGYQMVHTDLLREILVRLRAEVERLQGSRVPAAPPAESANELRTQLAGLHEHWKRKSNERFVLMVDEVECWFPDRRDSASEPALREFVALFRILRALAQERGMLSVFVTGYRPNVNRHNRLTSTVGENPMHLSFQENFLGFLDQSDTRQMIRDIGGWKEITWAEDALGEIYRACGGHPMLARFIASEACGQGSRKEVTVQDVTAVIEGIRGNFRKHRIGAYYEESVWATLLEDEREVLQWVASETGGEPGKALEDALVNLEHFGLIRRESSGLAVNGQLFLAWLQGRGKA